MDKAAELIPRFIEKTKDEPGMLWYGFAVTDNKVYCREAYIDGDAANAHLENVGSLLEEMLTFAEVDSLQIMGPEEELEKTKPIFEPLGTDFFNSVEGGYSNGVIGNDLTEENYNFVTLEPYFKINDMDKAMELIPQFIERTKSETGLVYYGFTINGDILHCQEAYVDGEATMAHLDNVMDLLGELLNHAELIDLSIKGPEEEVEKTIEGTKDFGTVYYNIATGLSKLSMP